MSSPELIQQLFEKGVLASRELAETIVSATLLQKLEEQPTILVINEDYVAVLSNSYSLVDWYELDKYRVEAEKERGQQEYRDQLQTLVAVPAVVKHQQTNPGPEISPVTTSPIFPNRHLNGREDRIDAAVTTEPGKAAPSQSNVSVVVSYQHQPRKYGVHDFTRIFLSRYRFLEGLLHHRQELQNILTVNRIKVKQQRESASIIGMVREIGTTKRRNLVVTLEDLTGSLACIFTSSHTELLQTAKELVPDEVVGISGTCGNGVLFADRIVWPDLPFTEELKSHKDGPEEYAIFLSDIHVGSALFLKEEFERFLEWIGGTLGDEQQRRIANRVKYIFIVGDLVDGVGVYPSQEDELEIKDISLQYAALARLLQRIPPDKNIIVCPGNHDMVHLAEPQPALYKNYAPELCAMSNVTLVTNPSILNIAKTTGFPGYDVLMYHGYSFDYYAANVEPIRNNGGYHRADLIMKFLLKRRHLAPSYTSTLYYPGFDDDPLLIRKVPDFFVTGHIHYSKVANYRGVTMISCSCWQGKTTFQERLGHKPEPARLPIVNLQNRDIKILRFG